MTNNHPISSIKFRPIIVGNRTRPYERKIVLPKFYHFRFIEDQSRGLTGNSIRRGPIPPKRTGPISLNGIPLICWALQWFEKWNRSRPRRLAKSFSITKQQLQRFTVNLIGRKRTILLPIVFFKKNGPFSPSFFFIFVFSIQLTVNVQNKFCQWLDSNRGPLELEATTLPTNPQPLPLYYLLLPKSNNGYRAVGFNGQAIESK